MSALFLLLILLCGVFALLRAQKASRRAVPGNNLLLEYRTDAPLDECIDRLRSTAADDIFAYTCEREPDGGFALHFTQHRATQQPIDTLYTLRLEGGRQTVISLVFVREAFGYQEPVFPLSLLDEFFAAKLGASRIQLT